MKTKLIPTLLILLSFLLGASAISALAQQYIAPSFNPPNCPPSTDACNAPINVGENPQNKKGPLNINFSNNTTSYPTGLKVWGKSIFAGDVEIGAIGLPAKLKIVDGNQVTPGSVLTNVNGDGVGTWVAPGASAAFTGSRKVCTGYHNDDNWFFMFEVNSSWTGNQCLRNLKSIHDSVDKVQLVCIFNNGTSSAGNLISASTLTTIPPSPSLNCGW